MDPNELNEAEISISVSGSHKINEFLFGWA